MLCSHPEPMMLTQQRFEINANMTCQHFNYHNTKALLTEVNCMYTLHLYICVFAC